MIKLWIIPLLIFFFCLNPYTQADLTEQEFEKIQNIEKQLRWIMYLTIFLVIGKCIEYLIYLGFAYRQRKRKVTSATEKDRRIGFSIK